MNIINVGRRKEGKTTLAKHLAFRSYAGVVMFDPRNMISGVVVSSGDELELAIEQGAWRDGPLVYRCKSLDTETEFAEVCSVLFPPNFSKGGFAFVIDEAGLLQSAHSINPDLLRIIKQHPTDPPNESVAVIQTNHRMSEFNNSTKALLDELYIFQTTLPADLEVLDEHTGLPEVSEIVKGLPPHHCVRYLYGRQPLGASQYEVWDDPSIWYTPLSGNTKPDTMPEEEIEVEIKPNLWKGTELTYA